MLFGTDDGELDFVNTMTMILREVIAHAVSYRSVGSKEVWMVHAFLRPGDSDLRRMHVSGSVFDLGIVVDVNGVEC